MNAQESLRILRMVKAICPAQALDDFSPEGWALILRNYNYADAETALEQLGGEQEYIHVSHIVGRVKRIRRDRIDDFGTLPDPPSSLDPADTAAYQDWLRRTTRDIADGKPVAKPNLAGHSKVDYGELMPKVPEDLSDAARAAFAEARQQAAAARAALAAAHQQTARDAAVAVEEEA